MNKKVLQFLKHFGRFSPLFFILFSLICGSLSFSNIFQKDLCAQGSNNFVVSSVVPDRGERGSNVTIYGNGFLKRSTVSVEFSNNTGIQNQSGRVINKTNTSLEVIVPPYAETGKIKVRSGSGGDFESVMSSFIFTVLSPPIIKEFYPSFGQVETKITIKGYNISGRYSPVVKFYNERTWGDVSIFTEGEVTEKGQVITMTGRVPEGASTGPIKVLTSNGSFTTTQNFVVGTNPPYIKSFSPIHGDIGTEVTLIGTFDSLKANNYVKFKGATVGVNPTYCDGSKIKVLVPPNSRTGQITVQTPGGEAKSIGPFYLRPTITGFNYNSGPVGFVIEIYGQNFVAGVTAVNIVKFNGIRANVFSVSSRQDKDVISVEVPAGATSGPVTVETPGGIARSRMNFTVVQ